jgi:site-specific DNA-methyltransferase (adenine-specific)
MQYQIFNLDCRDVMSLYLEDNSVDAIVTDPPYGLSFMGKDWDHGVPGIEFWKEMLRVLKPGGHLLSFGGSRTYHRMASAVEDAGFEIRDQIMWVYGSGFPKSLDVSKALDNASGAEREVIGVAGKSGITRSCMAGNFTGGEYMKTAPATDAARQWQGWGTALKPAHEPLVLARKPLIGTVAANVLAHGTGGLNIDGCRVPGVLEGDPMRFAKTNGGEFVAKFDSTPVVRSEGRWPANLIHDGSDEVVSCFPDAKGQQGDLIGHSKKRGNGIYGEFPPANDAIKRVEAETTAARFFYAAKASKKDRDDGNAHPTVKPTDLMAYLCRLVTPAGGVVLDPFMGSGSTGKAAIREGFRFIGAEREAAYYAIAEARLKAAAV